MNNRDYERQSVHNALATPEAKLANLDATIARHERQLDKLHEARRELVNLYGLNKPCKHEWFGTLEGVKCIKCRVSKT